MPNPRLRLSVAVLVAVLLFAVSAQAAPVFNLSPTAGTSAEALAGFQAAADLWSAILTDDVTINLTVGFTPLGGSIIGSASSTQARYSYTDVYAALLADALSDDDLLAVANLQGIPDLEFWINRTSNSPYGSGSATPYLDDDGDANNLAIRMSNANAKALGLLAAGLAGEDAMIRFNSDFAFDFDPSDGIAAGAFDFIGVAAHEIGHALGFISGVDILDINSPGDTGPFPDSVFTYFSVLDLYRYSELGLDWTADAREKFFSLDGGTTGLGTFSTGRTHGDGQQASHWEDDLMLGLMDPTAGRGELLVIRALDVRALDAIGWDLTTVPEPSTIALFALGLVGLAGYTRRRRNIRA